MMSKRPGRKPQSSAYKKRQLSSDAKIIKALMKDQPQKRDQLCQSASISDRTFYRIVSLLEEQQVIKCTDGMYSLWDFELLEKRVEDALSKLISRCGSVSPVLVVNEIGKPWPEIEAITYKMAKKLGLTIGTHIFYKSQKNIS
jgi:hypothetical protein